MSDSLQSLLQDIFTAFENAGVVPKDVWEYSVNFSPNKSSNPMEWHFNVPYLVLSDWRDRFLTLTDGFEKTFPP